MSTFTPRSTTLMLRSVPESKFTKYGKFAKSISHDSSIDLFARSPISKAIKAPHFNLIEYPSNHVYLTLDSMKNAGLRPRSYNTVIVCLDIRQDDRRGAIDKYTNLLRVATQIARERIALIYSDDSYSITDVSVGAKLSKTDPFQIEKEVLRLVYRNDPWAYNRELNSLEFKYKRVILESKPIFGGVCLTDRCNLRCDFCSKESQGKLQRRPLDDYKNLSEMFIGTVCTWQMDMFGEATEHPDFIEAVEWVDGKINESASISINTNGNLLTKDIVEVVRVSKFARVNVSLNSPDERTYELIMKGGSYNKVLNGVRSLVKARDDSKANSFKVSLSMILTEDTLGESEDFITLGENLGVDEVIIRALHLYPISVFDDIKQRYLEQIASTKDLVETVRKIEKRKSKSKIKVLFSPENVIWTNNLSRQVMFNNKTLLDMAGELPVEFDQPLKCSLPWSSFVNPTNDNRFSVCCFVLPFGLLTGDAPEYNFDDLWNGDMYQKLRRDIGGESSPHPCRAQVCRAIS
ncbi:MAG TPA: radical SAM protein [Nitrospirae bacterium]|nr:radical SAM protein [Nitrospirota bacterium]